MTFISKWLNRFCYNHPRFGIPNLMRYIIIGNILVYILDYASNGTLSALLRFIPGYIFHGQVWRLVTFVFVPTSSGSNLSGALFFAITLYFYYFIGTAMENRWGTAKFNIFYLCGIVLCIITGLIVGLFVPYISINTYYVNMSLFFALASLYPDVQFLLFFIIPIKAKWLAIADAVLFLSDMIRYISGGGWPLALLPAVAFINYLLFFGDDVAQAFGFAKAKARSAKTINFNAAKKKYEANQNAKHFIHKCAVCGITDTDHPDAEFRYCSKCNGNFCYCMNHINQHVHIT